MTRIWAVLLVLASFLLVAPVIESGTSESTQLFQAIGPADGLYFRIVSSFNWQPSLLTPEVP